MAGLSDKKLKGAGLLDRNVNGAPKRPLKHETGNRRLCAFPVMSNLFVCCHGCFLQTFLDEKYIIIQSCVAMF